MRSLSQPFVTVVVFEFLLFYEIRKKIENFRNNRPPLFFLTVLYVWILFIVTTRWLAVQVSPHTHSLTCACVRVIYSV